jgi:3D domain
MFQARVASRSNFLQGDVVKHDGFFFAADTGGAIKSNHIDVFCGVVASNCLPTLVASDPAKTFEALVVNDAAVVEALRALHK